MNRPMKLAAIFLVVSMFAAAEWLNDKSVIFPEIAALCCGAWVMEKPPWHFTPLKVCLSPTLAALTGVAILKWLPATPVVMICAAFILVALQLKAVGSGVVPSLSAAMLPILTNVDTLCYPLSVGILTAIIALVHLMRLQRGEEGGRALKCPVAQGELARHELTLWLKLTIGIAAVGLLAYHCHALFMIAPPLIVTFVEFSKPKSTLRRKAPRIIGLLALAALSGVVSVHVIHDVMHLPLWASAGVTFGSIFMLYHLFSLPFPPAAAIALLPTIIPGATLWQYPWHVVLGSTSFLLIGHLWFKEQEEHVSYSREPEGAGLDIDGARRTEDLPTV